jgi:hypothetical protein
MPILPRDPQQPERDDVILRIDGRHDSTDRAGECRGEGLLPAIGRNEMSWPSGSHHPSDPPRGRSSFVEPPGALDLPPKP